MQQYETEHKSAGKWAWFAQRDAKMRSAVNSTLYTDKQKVRAERIKLALGFCVRAEDIFIEYRKNFISVKVHKPVFVSKKELSVFENDWTAEGIVKVMTSQGFTYRLMA
jgi:hypothetical protein